MGESRKTAEKSEKMEAPTEAEQSPFDALIGEHRRILSMFDRIETSGRDEISNVLSVFSQIEEELKIHMEGEERFLYTVLESKEEFSAAVLERYEEHLLAKTTIAAFSSLALDDRRWGAKLRVLKKMLELHISEEERMFEKARQLLKAGESAAIAEKLKDLKMKGSNAPALGEPVADT